MLLQNTETSIETKALAPRIFYLVTADIITISQGDRTEFISSAHPLFGPLAQFLPRSSEFELEDLASEQTLIERSRKILIAQLDRSELSELTASGITLPDFMWDRLIEMHSKGVLSAPLLRFYIGLVSNGQLDCQTVGRIIKLVGTKVAPLTWDGRVVLYARSNMNPVSRVKAANFLLTTAPKKEVSYNLVTFDRASSQCSDAGILSDYVVRASEILAVNKDTFQVSNLELISNLDERHIEGRSTASIQADQIGKTVMRKPFNAQTAAAAAGYHKSVLLNTIRADLEASYQTSGC